MTGPRPVMLLALAALAGGAAAVGATAAFAFVLGALASAAAALLERASQRGATPAGADADADADLDARLRAGFARALVPWLVTSAGSILAVALALVVGGPTAPVGEALVAGAVVGAVVGAVTARSGAAALAASQVGALAAATWFAPVPSAAALPLGLALAGTLASGAGVVVARASLRPDLGDEEGPALARALVRPVVVAAALLLVTAELTFDRLDLHGPDDLRLPIAAGVVLAIAVTVGAPWPLPSRGERGAALLRLGALLRPVGALGALVVATAVGVLLVRGATGLALSATTLAALSAGPLGGAAFCGRSGAPATGRALRRRVGVALGTSAALAVVAGAAMARPTPGRGPDPDGGPRLVGAWSDEAGPERDD